MKVLLATPGTDVGGAERIVIALANALSHEVVVWGPAGALEPELGTAHVERIVVSPRGRTAAGVVEGVASLATAIRRVRPQVVHAHNPRVTGLAGVAARLARGPRRPPVLSTFHGVTHEEYRAAAALLRAADLVACVSPDLVAQLGAVGFPDARLRLVPNGVAAPADDPAAAARLDAELGLGGAPVVLAAGRLVTQKNHARFLDAAALVAAARPDVRFLLVGDGPLRGALEEQVRALGLGARVTLTGVRHDVPALLRRADLIAFSSDWEGLPLVALEALAAGTPVVSTPVEGMAELTAGGAATVIGEATAAALAEAITGLLAEPAALEERGERGRLHVEARYSPAAMLGAYEALYGELSGGRARRRP